MIYYVVYEALYSGPGQWGQETIFQAQVIIKLVIKNQKSFENS